MSDQLMLLFIIAVTTTAAICLGQLLRLTVGRDMSVQEAVVIALFAAFNLVVTVRAIIELFRL